MITYQIFQDSIEVSKNTVIKPGITCNRPFRCPIWIASYPTLEEAQNALEQHPTNYISCKDTILVHEYYIDECDSNCPHHMKIIAFSKLKEEK